MSRATQLSRPIRILLVEDSPGDDLNLPRKDGREVLSESVVRSIEGFWLSIVHLPPD